MSVVTISRDFGSEGEYIAEKVARVLRYHYVNKDFFATVLKEYGLVEFDREYDALPGFWEKFNENRYERRDEVVTMLNRVIQAVAQHGNVVILGRSGFEVLERFANILHVRLQAPLTVRIKRVMNELKLPIEKAENLVKENDKVHLSFVQEYYKMPWDAIHAFDLVVNTNKVSPDLATTWIVDTANALSREQEPDKPALSTLEIDPILTKGVSDALNCSKKHK